MLASLAATIGCAFAGMPLRSVVAASNDPSSEALDTMKPLQGTTPNAPVDTGDGGMAPLSALVDRPMLVNFWASWCPPCVHELPSLQVLDDALGGQGMAVMLVGVDRKGHDFAEQFLADRGITIPLRAHDKSGDLPRALGIKVMPTSYLIAPGGRLIGKIEGPLDWGQPEVIAAVVRALQG